VLQAVRDETHRFATSLNQKLRSKDLKIDALESVDGIGPAKAAALLTAFGSVEAIAAAEPDAIAAALKMQTDAGRELAVTVKAACELAIENRRAVGKRRSMRRPTYPAS
jgi:excinuclease ABC subunit C